MGRVCFIVNTVMTPGCLLLNFRTNLLMFWQSIFDVNKITEQLFLERSIYIYVSCIMITYPISSNFCKKRFSGILLALQFSICLWPSFMALQFPIFLASSFIGDFLFISFQQKNKIKKGNTLMELKYLTLLLENRFVWRQRFQRKLDRWNLIRKCV